MLVTENNLGVDLILCSSILHIHGFALRGKAEECAGHPEVGFDSNEGINNFKMSDYVF